MVCLTSLGKLFQIKKRKKVRLKDDVSQDLWNAWMSTQFVLVCFLSFLAKRGELSTLNPAYYQGEILFVPLRWFPLRLFPKIVSFKMVLEVF